jgi:hypothetical protein
MRRYCSVDVRILVSCFGGYLFVSMAEYRISQLGCCCSFPQTLQGCRSVHLLCVPCIHVLNQFLVW